MKKVCYVLCSMLFVLTIYVIEKNVIEPNFHLTGTKVRQNIEKNVDRKIEKTTQKKNCSCCNKKLIPAQKIAKQRQREKEAWARQIIAENGYEEGMKRITAKSPWLAKQMQRILDREKRLTEPSMLSQSVP